MDRDTKVLAVGGLGGSQMAAIIARMQAHPRCVVVDAGPINGYLADLAKLLDTDPLPYEFLIGHSMAGIPLLKLCETRRRTHVMVLDPVSDTPFVDSYPMPPDQPFTWCQRIKLGPQVVFGIEVPLKILNVALSDLIPWKINETHNELPYNEHVLVRAEQIADGFGMPPP